MFEEFMTGTPALLRWFIAVVITVGITVAMARVFHQRALDFNAIDDIAAEARKARIRAAEIEAEGTGEVPPPEPPLPPPAFNLSGRLLGLVATAFVFLLAFTFGNFWQNTKAASAASEAEAAYWTQAVFFADPVPAEQGGDEIRQALVAYRELTEKVQRTMGDPDFVAKSSPPSLIADTILGAVQSSNPKARYMAGYLAKPMWNLRRFGGDGLYDKAVSRILK